MTYLTRLAIAGVPALLLLVATLFQTSTEVTVPDSGAVLLVKPEVVRVLEGEEFSISVRVQAYEPINVAEATLLYPEDALELTAVNTSGSVIALWVDEPELSGGSGGEIHFSGGLYGDGHEGDGELVELSFVAQESGNMSVHIDNAVVYAHDGEGTEVLRDAYDARVVVTTPTPEPTPTPVAIGGSGSGSINTTSGETEPSVNIAGDLSGDGVVNAVDLGMMLTGMQQEDYAPQFDLNEDGRVDTIDFGIVLSGFAQ